MQLKTLIAEDEELARERLASFVNGHDNLQLVESCRNGREALKVLEANQIDIALLDIEMPGLNGIDLSRKLRETQPAMPVIVFVTGHARFAVEAFGVKATDYLLKPFDRERFEKAIETAIEHVRARRALHQRERILALVNEQDTASPHETAHHSHGTGRGRVAVSHAGRIQIIQSDQVDWIEANGRSCTLHCGTNMHCVDGPLFEVARRLGEPAFLQVSRFAFVNIDHIAELHEMFKGDLIAKLKRGGEVAVGRRYRKQVMQRLAGI